jgi:hypothetical protein
VGCVKYIDALEKEGWTRNQENGSVPKQRGGMASSAKLFRPEGAELTTITASRCRARASRPSAALSVASQLFIDPAATPPFQGGECA